MDGIETARRIHAMALDPMPHLVVITAYGREEVIREAEAEGIENVLIKPVSASILFDTVMHLLGACGRERRESQEGIREVDDNSISLAGARVLLVEDNEVNRDVASEILESVGCRLTCAGNGVEAVRAVAGSAFDLVLMDIQMPVQDGLSATREIRRLPGLDRLPIIAMTANALQEDRDRCIEAGMDDYISKPIDPEALFALLRKYCGLSMVRDAAPAPGRVTASSGAASLPGIPGLDTEGGLKRVMGNLRLYMDLLGRYVEGQKDAPERIRRALDDGDLGLAERLAHTLKGVSGNIGAGEVERLAGDIEAAIAGAAARPGIDEALGRLSVMLAGTMERISGAIAASGPGVRAEAAARRGKAGLPLGDILATLSHFLEHDDSEALDYIESTRDELSELCDRALLARLEASIRSFDFPAALEVIGRLRARGPEVATGEKK
jgi:two-component system sensor histidine kinase/response regulator